MKDTYYKDHWTDIESERFERYKQMFEWSEESRPLLEPAKISTGEKVVEIGCGPGFTACEIANWVGPSGHVNGIDVNAKFIDFGLALAKERSLEKSVTFRHVTNSILPFPDKQIDCVVAKNVFIYVDDPIETYKECYRILKPSGRVHVVESDWGLLFAEPVPEKDWKEFIDAASIAFRTPTIGRRLYGYARAAGFKNISVSTLGTLDTSGRFLPMIRNLCSYARQSNALDEKKIGSVLKTCEEAAKSQELLIYSPQFLVTAIC
jgi:ubiquinone/menaquinone biosynthesis C-methylase UbiE